MKGKVARKEKMKKKNFKKKTEKKSKSTWWLFGETEGESGCICSSSWKPRNSRALLPESTVVTAKKTSETHCNQNVEAKTKDKTK